MTIANARTNESGQQLFFGLDIHSMTSKIEYGTKVDPWVQIASANNERVHKVKDFFAEDDLGNLIHPHLGPYNLLMRHIMREVKPKMSTVVTIRSKGRAYSIEMGDEVFLVFMGKIYTKGAE